MTTRSPLTMEVHDRVAGGGWLIDRLAVIFPPFDGVFAAMTPVG
jgi:hypothetical protein